MDFGWSDDEAAFRDRVRGFLDDNWGYSSDGGEEGSDRGREFEKTLAEHGWLTLAWPTEYGGQGAPHVQQMIYKEEAALHGAPTGGGGVSMLGPTLMIHGTEEQRAEHLPRIANAEVLWC